MQSDKSPKAVRGRTARGTAGQEVEEVLSSVEVEKAAWGREFRGCDVLHSFPRDDDSDAPPRNLGALRGGE